MCVSPSRPLECVSLPRPSVCMSTARWAVRPTRSKVKAHDRCTGRHAPAASPPVTHSSAAGRLHVTDTLAAGMWPREHRTHLIPHNVVNIFPYHFGNNRYMETFMGYLAGWSKRAAGWCGERPPRTWLLLLAVVSPPGPHTCPPAASHAR